MLLDGKKLASEIQNELKQKIQKIQGRKPGLTVILVGNNPASISYVKAKKRACESLGIVSKIIQLSSSISEADLIREIYQLNKNERVDGILVQLPLPKQINATTITAIIDPKKDVDGFHPENMGKLLLGQKGGFYPCTPLAIQTLLKYYQIPIKGKHMVILGRSNIVGKPLAALFMQKEENCNATVTIAHSQSQNLAKLSCSADILVASIGIPHFVSKEMVKKDATVIDVGINRQNNRLVGDIDFDEVSKVAAHITPVPGGVGPMTIAMLLKNTFSSFLKVLTLLFLLISCQKEDNFCTHFKGELNSRPYRVTIGKNLKKREKKEVQNTIENASKCYANLFDLKNPNSELSLLN